MKQITDTIQITHANADTYDFTITVCENDFQFEDIDDTGEVDVVSMNGEVISIENLRNMYFKINDAIISLGALYQRCLPIADDKACEWRDGDAIDLAQEYKYQEDVRSIR